MKLGVVGASGLVGQAFLKLLEKSNFHLEELRLFSQSQKKIKFQNKTLISTPIQAESFKDLDICFFSAGSSVSKQWAQKAVEAGSIVVDNSSAFRQASSSPLIVPEVNGNILEYKPQIIANPNCSTIQLVMVLGPLQKLGLKKVRVVSLQSISGAGRQALNQLKTTSQQVLNQETTYKTTEPEYAFNCLPLIGELGENGFCEEEMKIHHESRKILGLKDLDISAFTVRVPTLNSHSIVCSLDLDKEVTQKDLETILSQAQGVKLVTKDTGFPHGRHATEEAEVFVGRIHQDLNSKTSWFLWIVADNLLKGASLNSLQITEKLVRIKK